MWIFSCLKWNGFSTKSACNRLKNVVRQTFSIGDPPITWYNSYRGKLSWRKIICVVPKSQHRFDGTLSVILKLHIVSIHLESIRMGKAVLCHRGKWNIDCVQITQLQAAIIKIWISPGVPLCKRHEWISSPWLVFMLSCPTWCTGFFQLKLGRKNIWRTFKINQRWFSYRHITPEGEAPVDSKILYSLCSNVSIMLTGSEEWIYIEGNKQEQAHTNLKEG